VKNARDIMQVEVPTISDKASVRALARELVESNLEGICVVRHDGSFAGVVTAMDLIFQEKKPRMPAVFTFLEGVFTFGLYRTREELTKIAGTTVADIMTAEPETVSPGTPLDVIATLMVHQHITVVPVLDGGKLVGVITKPSVLRAAFLSDQ
jgi:CBS domain-containing protein